MIRHLIGLFIVFSTCNVATNEHAQTKEIRCIEVKQTFPRFDKEGKLHGYNNSNIRVYYYKDLTLYDLFYSYYSNFQDSTVKPEEREHFFIFKKGDKYGMNYDSNKKPESRRKLIDSVFRHEWIAKNYLYGDFVIYDPVLLSKKRNKDSGTLDVSYSMRDKRNKNIEYSKLYLSYQKDLKNMDVSLSRQFDSLYNMKLCRAKFLYNKRLLEDKETVLDAFEVNYSLLEIQILNKEEIMNYFTKFITDDKKYQ